MKYLLIAFLLATNLSCATTRVNETKSDYPHLTFQNIIEQCEAKNNWTLNVLGVAILVGQFENCLGIDNLVIAGVKEDTYTEDVRRHTLDLSMLHFQIYLKERVDKNKSWNAAKIKEENSNGGLIYFYKITSQNVECMDNTCKRQVEE